MIMLHHFFHSTINIWNLHSEKGAEGVSPNPKFIVSNTLKSNIAELSNKGPPLKNP